MGPAHPFVLIQPLLPDGKSLEFRVNLSAFSLPAPMVRDASFSMTGSLQRTPPWEDENRLEKDVEGRFKDEKDMPISTSACQSVQEPFKLNHIIFDS